VIRRLLCFAALLVAAAVGSVAQGKIGDQAPQFSMRAINGRPINLANYRGKVVLLNFWATWCTPCQTEMPRFVAFQRQLGPKGFQVVGISMDDEVAPVRAFTAKLKPNYPIGMGTTKLAESYGGVLGLPITLLIDREGNIAKRYEGTVDLDAMKNDIQKLLDK
jgi:peroxiredoxin